MKKLFIVHGFEGMPNGAWRPWLMRELERLNVYTCALPMPDPYFPKRDVWVNELARVIPQGPCADIYLVGHSLGVPTILNYLELHPDNTPFGGVFLVSGPCEKNETASEATLKKLSHFYDHPFDFELIKKKSLHFSVLHGDDDQIVPLRHGQKLSAALNSPLLTIPKGGHLNGASGFYTLPQLLDEIVQVIKN